MESNDCKCPVCGNDAVRWVADSSDADIYVCDKCSTEFPVKK